MTTDNGTRRQLRILRAYTVLSTTVLGFLAITAFHRASQKARFEQIDVEQINLVEKDGRVADAKSTVSSLLVGICPLTDTDRTR